MTATAERPLAETCRSMIVGSLVVQTGTPSTGAGLPTGFVNPTESETFCASVRISMGLCPSLAQLSTVLAMVDGPSNIAAYTIDARNETGNKPRGEPVCKVQTSLRLRCE